MLRNSTLYRRWWYIKRRRAKRWNLYIGFVSIVIIFALAVSYAEKKLMPPLVEISESKIKGIMAGVMNDAVDRWFPEGMKYEDFVTVTRDGGITSVQTNMARLTRISAGMCSDIMEKLSTVKREDIAVPFGTLLGNGIFSGMGPDLYVKVVPAGNVEMEFKSEFTAAGVNQTRHRIILEVRARMNIAAPLVKRQIELTNDIPVAETVIVCQGDGSIETAVPTEPSS